MNITELLVTAYDGDKPVLAIDFDPDLITTVLTATNEAGSVEAAQRTIVAVDERATRVLEAVRELVQRLSAVPSESDGSALTR
jgi:cellulose biosynthesis protein BcsQ